MPNQAKFFSHEKDKIRCDLCPHHCLLGLNQIGVCQVRKNSNSQLVSLNYGNVTSIALDPIEKKPLYHFKPGKKILSIASFGCNMKCQFCQNYQISQLQPKANFLTPDDLVHIISDVKDNIGIAFTYNEPFIWYEYVYDSARKIKEKLPDKDIVLVTNGYINEEPLLEILPYIDAMNIDLKAFSQDFYRNICKADLAPVLETIKTAFGKTHIEITTLMITEENDSLSEIEQIALFLSKMSPDIPLHLSRYYPHYLFKKPPTDIKKMIAAKNIANRYLNYVYLGNIPNADQNTYCPNCHHLVIDRDHFTYHDKCPECGNKINIKY